MLPGGNAGNFLSLRFQLLLLLCEVTVSRLGGSPCSRPESICKQDTKLNKRMSIN
jgi:hypothetical protein